MEVNNLTEKAQQAIVRAQRLTEEHHNPEIDPEHILLALLEQADGVVPRIVLGLGNDPQRIKLDITQVIDRKPTTHGDTTSAGLSSKSTRILHNAEREASGLRDEYISTEHVLLAMVDTSAGEISRFLHAHDIKREAVLRVLASIRGTQRVTSQHPESEKCR